MRLLNRIISQVSGDSSQLRSITSTPNVKILSSFWPFSTKSGGGGGNEEGDWGTGTGRSSSSTSEDMGWEDTSPWSTGLTKEHFDGEVVGRQIATSPVSGDKMGPASQFASVRWTETEEDKLKELDMENKKGTAFVNGWGDRMMETSMLLKQVREPGARGSYLKDSEKAEMYRLHKENPEVYTVEKLAKDYRIMRQRVHAILWLKELEEEEEKKHGPLDDSVELLLDTCPE